MNRLTGQMACACLRALILVSALPMSVQGADPAQKEEKTLFKADTASLTVGRDGCVYLGSTGEEGCILRMNRDGTERRLVGSFAPLRNIAANAAGMMAVAVGGGGHELVLYDPDFYCLQAMGKIYGGTEEIGLSAPAHVEAGAGDFYAADQYRDRIVRCGAFGKRKAIYRIPRENAKDGEIRDFRICEKKGLLYVLTSDSVIRCFDISAKGWSPERKKLWSSKIDVTWGEPADGGGIGGFDVDDQGVLYVTDGKSDVIKRFGSDGKAMDDLKLRLPEKLRPQGECIFQALRVEDGELLLKRKHASELFQRYDIASGAFKSAADLTDPAESTPAPQRVLFIGNSQIASCGSSIPAIVEELSQSEKEGVQRIEAEEVVLFGASLQDMWTQAEGFHKILNGRYDWVVIHESVFQPKKDLMAEYLRKFYAGTQMKGQKLLILATADLDKKRDNHAVMYANALAMARELHCKVAGGGMAWLKAWDKRKDLDLHAKDRGHPNEKGFYLNACVLYAALTGRSPVGLDPYVLSKDDAEFLQQVALDQASEDRKQESSPASQPATK